MVLSHWINVVWCVGLQDLDSEVKKISFSKNGEDVGEAFDLPEEVQGKALFPHIVIKNTECTLNFGSQVCNMINKPAFVLCSIK